MINLPNLRSRLNPFKFATVPLVQRATTTLKNPNPLKAWLLAQEEFGSANTIPKGMDYSNSVWVYACLNTWTQLAQVPLLLKRDDDSGTVNVELGEVHFLLKNPFPGQTTSDLLELIILHLGLYGQAFILRNDGELNKNQLPQFLRIVNPDQFVIKKEDIDSSGKVFQRTLLLGNQRERKIPVDGYIQIKLPNPYSDNNGLSPISAARLTIDADYSARLHNKAQMANRGRIEGVVTYEPQHVNNLGKLHDLKRLFNEFFTGAVNAGSYVHSAGIKDIKQLSQSMKDLDWLEGQKLSREEICAIFGVPPNMVGILDRATFSNYDQAAKSLWTEQNIPLGNRITNKLQSDIVDPFQRPPATLCFDFQNSVPVLADNTTEKITQYTNLITHGRLTPETSAEIVGLDIGELQEIHSTVLIPMNLVPAEDVLMPPDIASPSEPDTEGMAVRIAELMLEAQEAKRAADEEAVEVELIDEQSKARAADRERLRTNIWRAHIVQRTPFERKMAASLKTYFFQQRKEVLKNADVFIGQHLKAGSGTEKTVIDKSIFGDLPGSLFDKKKENKKIKSKFKTLLDDIFRIAAIQVLEELGKPLDFFDEGILTVYRQQQDILLEQVNETTIERLTAVQKDLDKALLNGTPVGELADQMKSSLKHVYNIREHDRTRIARTEINRGFSGGRFEQMKAAGISTHQWLSARDSAVRHSHSDIDGDVVVVGEKFRNGLEYPLDPSGPASETINCRCVALAVLE